MNKTWGSLCTKYVWVYPITCVSVCVCGYRPARSCFSSMQEFRIILPSFSLYNGTLRLSNPILMRGRIVAEKKLFLFLPFSPWGVPPLPRALLSRDKQLTFGMTHSTLISTKYATVPLFEAVNLISEGISHLAIIFWTIKPISGEQGLSGGLFSANYVEPFVSMCYTLLNWAIVVRVIDDTLTQYLIFSSFFYSSIDDRLVLMWVFSHYFKGRLFHNL